MSESVDPTENPGSSGAGAARTKEWRHSFMIALWGFLALFLVLIYAFREVLFPFLMAMFVAYLVEPVVSWVAKGKRLGLRWGRGPTLILMYAIVLVGAFLMVSCGVQKLGTSVQREIAKLKTEFDATNAAAEFRLAEPARSKISIPADTELSLDRPGSPSRRYRTAFDAQIDEGLTTARVLLNPVDGATIPEAADLNAPLAFVDRARLVLPMDKEGGKELALTARVDDTAKGLEVVLNRRLIAPVLAQVERSTGQRFDPGVVRNYITEQSRVHGSDLPGKIVAFGQGAIFRVLGSMYEVLLILMLTAFIVVDRRGISEFFASLPPPNQRANYQVLMSYVDRGLAGVIRGQLLICVVNGLLTWVGLVIYGIPYAAPLACVAAVFSLIPVFGTIASSIPIVLVAFTTAGAPGGLFAVAWIGLIHLLEANLFNPLIMGSNAEMHPVIIIFALLAGEHAFGIWGALLAVPTASIIQSCFKYYRHEVVGIPREESHKHGQWIRSLLDRLRGRKAASSKGPHA
jgi:predicted PurR-regulated permease PerM